MLIETLGFGVDVTVRLAVTVEGGSVTGGLDGSDDSPGLGVGVGVVEEVGVELGGVELGELVGVKPNVGAG